MANRLKDINGQRFHKLLVVGRNYKTHKWICLCDCGNYKEVDGNRLTSGRTKQCPECSKKQSRKDLTGQKFGRLTALYMTKCEGHAYWMCRCDCGNEKEIAGASLSDGSTRSCGCLQRERASEIALAHRTHKESRTRLYKVWRSMKTRIDNPNCEKYKNYGGRGITICDEWRNDFTVFRDWALANGYDPNAPFGITTIDRIDVNGNYCPENCRWVDLKTQSTNKQKKGVSYAER